MGNAYVLTVEFKEKAQRIKLVVFDVDGVLTDGSLHYSAQGEETKVFNVKDGVGIKLLQTYGIATAIISAKESAALAKRAKDLKITHFSCGKRQVGGALDTSNAVAGAGR